MFIMVIMLVAYTTMPQSNEHYFNWQNNIMNILKKNRIYPLNKKNINQNKTD